MAFCPDCGAEIEDEPEAYEEGDVVECPECGADLEVASISPLEFELAEFEDDLDDEDDEDDGWD